MTGFQQIFKIVFSKIETTPLHILLDILDNFEAGINMYTYMDHD